MNECLFEVEPLDPVEWARKKWGIHVWDTMRELNNGEYRRVDDAPES